MFRSVFVRQAASVRLFNTSARLHKSPVDTVKDGLKTVDRVAADAAVKGIDAGEAAAQSIKSSVNSATGTAKEYTGEASGKASELAGQASGKKEELKGQATGKKEELKGQVKGKASELQGEAERRTS